MVLLNGKELINGSKTEWFRSFDIPCMSLILFLHVWPVDCFVAISGPFKLFLTNDGCKAIYSEQDKYFETIRS